MLNPFKVLEYENIRWLSFHIFIKESLRAGPALFAYYVLFGIEADTLKFGVVLTLGYTSSSILSFFSGIISDKLGRRETLMVASILEGIGWLGLVVSKNWVQLALIYALIFGVSSMRFPAYAGVVSDSFPSSKTGQGLGYINTFTSLVSILGTFLGAVIAQRINFLFLFILIAVVKMISIFPLFRLKGSSDMEMKLRAVRGNFDPKDIVRENPMLALLSFLVFWGVIASYAEEFFPDYVKRSYDATPFQIGIFDTIYRGIWTIGNYPLGWLSDRIGHKRILILGYILMGISWFFFPNTESIYQLYLLYGIFSLGNCMGYFLTALVMDVVPRDIKSSAVGISEGVISFGAAISALLGGFLWQRLGSEISFRLPLPVYLIVVLAIWRYINVPKGNKKENTFKWPNYRKHFLH